MREVGFLSRNDLSHTIKLLFTKAAVLLLVVVWILFVCMFFARDLLTLKQRLSLQFPAVMGGVPLTHCLSFVASGVQDMSHMGEKRGKLQPVCSEFLL